MVVTPIPENLAIARRFGAFSGVFTPSILSILGVIMYLRLPWIVGIGGLWTTLGIILLAHVISLTTGLSVASVATDKRVETGGSYYIISRSLGLPIGGTLGVALFIGLSFSVSLYLLGFAETFLSYFGFAVTLQNIRIAGSVTLLLVTVVTFISTSLAIKTQYLIMAAIGLSLVSVFFGSHEFVPRQPLMMPADEALPWITLFAIFFPAVTGFQAGVSMSGDLKDPRKSIPLGTISAILFGMLVYTGLAFFFSYTVNREMLINDPQVLFQISMVPQLVIAGILGATLSSGLVSIMGAPRILQAVAMDRILPGFFSKGYGPSNEPRNALVVAFLIAQAGILIGELNAIARIVTIFFIIIYGFLNITYTLESWAGSDFRPSFKIPRVVSIIGALACIVVMIQLDLVALVIASVLLIALFLFLKKKEFTLQSGDAWTGVWSSLVKTGLGRLSVSGNKSRNWRPNVMLFSGGEKNRPHLIEMGKALVGKMGVFTNFELIEEPGGDILSGLKEQRLSAVPSAKTGVFTRRHTCRDIYEGMDMISRVYGFTGFEPNTVLMGWARNTRQPDKFARLLSNLRRQDYNCVFLSYDKEKGFGNYKKIDCWWSGKGRELSLMIFLLRFITSSDQWRTARVRILVVNPDSSKTDRLYSLINQLLENHRLKAEVKVIQNSVEQRPEKDIIKGESWQADLTMMELPEFSVKDPVSIVEKANVLAGNVHTALFVTASSSFDEISVLKRHSDGEDEAGADPQRPSADILGRLKLSSREIIANEVHNIGQSAARFLEKYYVQCPEHILEENQQFFGELERFILKTIDALKKAAEQKTPDKRLGTFLKILNDFSFHSQRHIQLMRSQRLTEIHKMLETANSEYMDELRAMLNVMPEKIRIKLSRKEFGIKKHDSFRTRLYKAGKIIVSAVTGKPVSHKIRITPAGRFFLYHKRLQSMHRFLEDFAFFTFSEVVEIRQLFNGIHELIEKSRMEPGNRAKTLERIRLERSRLAARVQVLDNEGRKFYYEAGQKLFDELVSDLQQFNFHLESTGANIKSRNFKVYFKQDPLLVNEIAGFAGVWEKNLGGFINKANLDFYVLSLRNRMHAKIRKYCRDFRASLETSMVRQVEQYEQYARELLSAGEINFAKTQRLEPSDFEVLPVYPAFRKLYAEIREILPDIPEKIEISGEQLDEKIVEAAFAETERVVVSFRKTIDYYIGRELIDPTIKQTHEAEQQLQQSVSSVKDMVRLLNFSMGNESKEDEIENQEHRQQQFRILIKNFVEKISGEKEKIREVGEKVEDAFETGLKKGFEPLSSSTIGRTSMVVKKKMKALENDVLSNRFQRNWTKLKDKTRDRFVEVLYSKSEGQLWMSHAAQADRQSAGSNQDILSFVEAITPEPGLMKELPFYYASLFSGQSEAGEDFWVGRKKEINDCSRAIQRFKSGFSGALIITGERSSGKSSMSRKMADRHFSKEQIHAVRAPQACSADVELFTRKLLEAIGAQNRNIDDVFRALPAGKAIIIQDLGLWWERRPGGDAVVEMIKRLIDHFGHKCLFILNVNTHALRLIDRQTMLIRYSLATVNCAPFDARDLKNMLLLRHQAGGMKLRYNKKDEDRMTAWDQARLFNKLFDLSHGNPGTATILWLASIKKVSGKTLIMQPLWLPDPAVFEQLTPEQWFYVHQFVVNRRFSIEKLALNIEVPQEKVATDIRTLLRAGILVEKFDGIYAIRPGLDHYLVDLLKAKKRL